MDCIQEVSKGMERVRLHGSSRGVNDTRLPGAASYARGHERQPEDVPWKRTLPGPPGPDDVSTPPSWI